MTPAVDLAPGLEKCFLFDAVETSYELTGVRGEVPAWLRGVYYVNGPARFERAGARYRHWLDGDGMVCSLRFSDNGIRFTSRFVKTPKLRDESEQGRFLYRGFGTAFEGDRLRHGLMLEPPVNVSAYCYEGRLLAFGEQSLPYDLDPDTLETRGEYDFHGKLQPVTPFAAHPKFDPNLINFGIQFSATQPTLSVFEFDPTGNLVSRKRRPLRWQHSLHDFAFTPSQYVFFLSPLLMNFDRFWKDGVSVMESLSWEPDKGSEILVVPRHGSSTDSFCVPAGNRYCLHTINAFERGDKLTLDILELDEPVYKEYQPIPDLFGTMQRCRPVRFIIDTHTRTLADRIEMSYDRGPDFPSIHPDRAGAEYDDFWMLGMSAQGPAGRKFFDQLAHGSWKLGAVRDVFQAPRGEYLGGEPVFVPNPDGSGQGAVIVEHLIPGANSEFLVFDAARVARGPIAILPLTHAIHPGFHASFRSGN